MTMSARGLTTASMFMLCAFSSAHTAAAQAPGSTNAGAPVSTATGRLRGTLWDTMLLQPLAGAVVWIPGLKQTATTDNGGGFELNGVPTGSQVVAFSSAAFDSTGLGTLQRGIVVQATGSTTLSVATPSLAALWKQICDGAKATGADSGIVWGTVRDAATGLRQHGASVGFSWYDARVGKDKKMLVQELSHEVRTDSTGTYYACGLPTEMRISSEATGTQAASGVVEYLIGTRRMSRVDLVVSTDMVLQSLDRERTPAESIAALKPHGRATLRGVVRDTKGELQRDATITLASLDTVIRTDERGEFRLTNLPAGTQVLQARRVGYAPASALVDLLPDSSTSALLVISKSTELATVNVRAERVAGVDKRGFDERRREGFGYALLNKDFKNRPDLASVLQGTPGVHIKRIRPGEFLLQTNAACTVAYVNGALTPIDAIAQYRPEDLRAVEVYPRFGSSPPMYAVTRQGAGCGVILFWTMTARW